VRTRGMHRSVERRFVVLNTELEEADRRSRHLVRVPKEAFTVLFTRPNSSDISRHERARPASALHVWPPWCLRRAPASSTPWPIGAEKSCDARAAAEGRPPAGGMPQVFVDVASGVKAERPGQLLDFTRSRVSRGKGCIVTVIRSIVRRGGRPRFRCRWRQVRRFASAGQGSATARPSWATP